MPTHAIPIPFSTLSLQNIQPFGTSLFRLVLALGLVVDSILSLVYGVSVYIGRCIRVLVPKQDGDDEDMFEQFYERTVTSHDSSELLVHWSEAKSTSYVRVKNCY